MEETFTPEGCDIVVGADGAVAVWTSRCALTSLDLHILVHSHQTKLRFEALVSNNHFLSRSEPWFPLV